MTNLILLQKKKFKITIEILECKLIYHNASLPLPPLNTNQSVQNQVIYVMRLHT